MKHSILVTSDDTNGYLSIDNHMLFWYDEDLANAEEVAKVLTQGSPTGKTYTVEAWESE